MDAILGARRGVFVVGILLAGAFAVVAPVAAQEVIVANKRVAYGERDEEPTPLPAAMFRRRADHVVQRLLVVDDTRNADLRLTELKAAIGQLEQAAKASKSVEIALVVENEEGPVLVRPFDRERAIASIQNGSRPDTYQVALLAKTAIGADDRDRTEPVARIEGFLRAVRLDGRAQVESNGEPALSIVKPEQYRPQVMAAIAADVHAITEQLGAGYGGKIEGLESPVAWTQLDELELGLYVPYQLSVSH
jgi:hypothetical protein